MDSQYDLVKAKILKQASLVLAKFKPSRSKEITNQELTLLLFSYSSGNNIPEMNKEMLHDGLSQLTPKQMQVVSLVFFQGKTQTEVCQELKLDKSTVSEHIEKALKTIKSQLGKRG